MTYRKLDQRDHKKLLELIRELKAEGHDLSVYEYLANTIRLRTHLREQVFTGAFDGEKLVGMLRARIDKSHSHKCKLCMGFTEHHRGQGLALKLFEASVEAMKNAGLQVIHALIFSDNGPSIAFARKCGFEYTGRFPLHHLREGKPVDDLIYTYYL